MRDDICKILDSILEYIKNVNGLVYNSNLEECCRTKGIAFSYVYMKFKEFELIKEYEGNLISLTEKGTFYEGFLETKLKVIKDSKKHKSEYNQFYLKIFFYFPLGLIISLPTSWDSLVQLKPKEKEKEKIESIAIDKKPKVQYFRNEK